jgi:hypothetical protein
MDGAGSSVAAEWTERNRRRVGFLDRSPPTAPFGLFWWVPSGCSGSNVFCGPHDRYLTANSTQFERRVIEFTCLQLCAAGPRRRRGNFSEMRRLEVLKIVLSGLDR